MRNTICTLTGHVSGLRKSVPNIMVDKQVCKLVQSVYVKPLWVVCEMANQKNRHHLIALWLTIKNVVETACGVVATRRDVTENEMRFKGFTAQEKMCLIWAFAPTILTKKVKVQNTSGEPHMYAVTPDSLFIRVC